MLSGVSLQLIVIVVVLVILLTFVGIKFLPFLIGQSDEEICRLSILSRATVPAETQNLIPLTCTAKKFCFSLNGEKCPQFVGEKSVQNIKLPSDPTKAANLIAKTTAEEWYSCWSVSGEGKLNIFPPGKAEALSSDLRAELKGTAENFAAASLFSQKIYPKCLVCARLALSPEVEQREDILQRIDVNDYAAKNNVPGKSETFLEAMTDRQFSAYPREFQSSFSKSGDVSTNQVGIIFMQMIVGDKSAEREAITSGAYTGIAVGATLLGSQAGKVVGIKGVAGLSGLAGVISGVYTYFQTRENQALAALHCGPLVSVKGSANSASYGCSIVTPMDFNSTKINDFCNGGLEGKI